MTFTLSIEEICQIIIAVAALIALFRDNSDRRNKKK